MRSTLPPPSPICPGKAAIGLSIWPGCVCGSIEAIFSANTAHIMGLDAVEAMFAGVGAHLKPGGVFALYGPFSRDDQHAMPVNNFTLVWEWNCQCTSRPTFS